MAVETELKVTYSEIDRMGIVHNCVYPLWFEKGRLHFLQKAGVSNDRISSMGLFLPLVGMECSFKRPARINDEITVVTELLKMTCVKVKFGYRALDRKNGKLLATGTSTHVWTDRGVKPLNVMKLAPGVYEQLQRFVETESNGRAGDNI